MAWSYEQASGRMSHAGSLLASGYSGHGAGLNNPATEERHGVGPIPKGHYKIVSMSNSPHSGECTLELTPMATTHVFGRSGFAIHGDNGDHARTASTGGIVIVERGHREAIWNSGVRDLMVE